MSGFLHHLATRSLGLAPQVKTRAALPYGGLGEEPLGTDGPVPDATPLDLSPATLGRHEQPRPQQAPAPLVRRDTPHETGAEPRSPVRSPAATKDNEALPINTSRTVQETVPGNTDESRRAALQSVDTPPNHPAPVVPNPAAMAHSTHPEPAFRPRLDGEQNSFDTLITRLLSPKPTAATPPDPPSLPKSASPLAPAPQANTVSPIRSPARRERPQMAATARDSESDATPEVHITIGRLEVNPPSRPTPPPPRPRGPAPLSLSDYLARRSGGRS